ncbi:hypothetical protein EBME_2119 [bacterium endosymbiont of Mortierella elongata FMR23-6]|nr:hypothetical protein EBME_2119 [bacterium endosymbiont of Mortierella elongata FMR23-6]
MRLALQISLKFFDLIQDQLLFPNVFYISQKSCVNSIRISYLIAFSMLMDE